MPTAVIRTDSRGAFRSRRYATNSIPALMPAPNTIAIRNVRARPPTTPIAEVAAVRPRSEVMIVVAKSPLSANTSPWAKLISWRIPYTSVYPSAISA